MDFRSVTPSSVSWQIGRRGFPVARGPGNAVVRVQTPPFACTVGALGSGMFRIDLALHPRVDVHQDFGRWVGDLEAAAAEAPAVAGWKCGRTAATCVYRGSMRLMAFSDTPTFDREGRLAAGLLDAAGCECILELQGAWGTDGRWGLRWKISQLKYYDAPPTLPVRPDDGGSDDDKCEGPPGVACGFSFLDD
jgi:hypothetical protein